MKSMWNQFKADWKSETPKVWRVVRNVAATTLVVLPTATGVASVVPEVQGLIDPLFWKAVFAIMFISGLITGYAGKQKTV